MTTTELVALIKYQVDANSKSSADKDVKSTAKNIEKTLTSVTRAGKNLLRAMGVTVGLRGLWKEVKKFDGVTDTITEVKKEWTDFGKELDKSLEVGKTISATIKKGSDFFLKKVREMSSKFVEFTKKVGGIQTILKTILYLVTAISSVKMLEKLFPSIAGWKAKVLVGLLTALFLIIEDIYYFMQGKGSLLGDTLEEMGISADEARKWLEDLKTTIFDIGKAIAEGLGIDGASMAENGIQLIALAFKSFYKFVIAHADEIKDFFTSIAKAINDFFKTDENGESKFSKIVDGLQTVFDWITKIVDFLGPEGIIGIILGGKALSAVRNSPLAQLVKQSVLEGAMEGLKQGLSDKAEAGTLGKLGSAVLKRLGGGGEAAAAGAEVAAAGGGVLTKILGVLTKALPYLGAFAAVGTAIYTVKESIDVIKGEGNGSWLDKLSDKGSDWLFKLLHNKEDEAAYERMKAREAEQSEATTEAATEIPVEEVSTENVDTAGIEKSVDDTTTSVTDKITNLISKATSWGTDLWLNFKAGLDAGFPSVQSSIQGAIDWIYANLHFSVPDEGPLSTQDEWGADFSENFAKGIKSKIPAIKSAVEGVSSAMNVDVSANTVTALKRSSAPVNVTQNVNINNSFAGGERAAQVEGAKAMNKSSKDATDYMARALETAGV